jgi:exodeoxyribonuclease-3
MLVIGGDYNIAPHDDDVHDPKSWEGSVLTHDEVRKAWHRITNIGIYDACRVLQPTGKTAYSWWDYRAGSFRRNHGWRIDHHYLTPELYERSLSCEIDINPRKNPQPSDHTPVIVEL